MSECNIDQLMSEYRRQKVAFSGFMQNVVNFFADSNDALFDSSGKSVVHSVKFREKDANHLRTKIIRKHLSGQSIDKNNFFHVITDFCGVRVLHLRLRDFVIINDAIKHHLSEHHWSLFEPPKAYTWDPESKAFF